MCLIAAELVFRRGNSHSGRFTFKHALVRDAAYESMLKSKRKNVHADIARQLERSTGRSEQPNHELIAQHYSAAGLESRAIPHWRLAGQAASNRFENKEALAHLNNGLSLVDALGDEESRLREELTLRLVIGGVLIALDGYPAQKVADTFMRALELSEQIGDRDKLSPILGGLWSCYFARGNLQHCLELAQRLHSTAKKGDNGTQAYFAGRTMGPTLLMLGRLKEASEAFERANLGLSAKSVFQGEHPKVHWRCFGAWSLWLRGFPGRALQMMETALTISMETPHSFSRAVCLGFSTFLYNWCGDYDKGLEHAELTRDVAQRGNLPLPFAFGTIGHGDALFGLGQTKEALESLCLGLERWNRVGARIMETQWLGLIAKCHIDLGQLDQANEALTGASQLVRSNGERYVEAELVRIRGMHFLHQGMLDDAEQCFGQSIEIASKQGAKSIELLSRLEFSRMLAENGERQRAHDLILPICDCVNEGFSVPAFKEAKTLLAQLS